MNKVNNRKMFAKRDARNRLSEMGGILSSSPELLGEVQKFANGGPAYLSQYQPNRFAAPDRRRLEDSAFKQYGMNLNADNTLSPVTRAPSPVKTLEERGFNMRDRQEILSIATDIASQGIGFDEAIERAVSMFESKGKKITSDSIEIDAGLPALKQTLNNLTDKTGPNTFEEAGIMQFKNPRLSVPIPGMDVGMTDSASLRAGVVRPDMMPPGFNSEMPSEEMMFSSSPQGGMDALAMKSLQKTIDNPSTRTVFGVPLNNMASEKRKIAAQEKQKMLQEGISNIGQVTEATTGPFASDADFRGLPSAEQTALENASKIFNDSTSTIEQKNAAQLALYKANVNKTDVETKQKQDKKINIELEEKRKEEEKKKTLEKTNMVTQEKSEEISNLNNQINQLLNGEDIINLGNPKSNPTPDGTPDPVKKDTSLAARNKEMQALYQEMFGEDEKEVAAAKWNQLAMVGFAIAAGQDPNALTNIAAGLLEGAKQTRQDVATRQARKDKIQMSAFEAALSQSAADTKFGRDLEIAKLRLEGQGGYLKDESPTRLYNKFLDSYMKANKELALEGGFLPMGKNGKEIEGEEALNFIQEQASKQALASVQQTHPTFKVSSPTLNAPPIGTITEGYRFMGGDPANKNNWEKV